MLLFKFFNIFLAFIKLIYILQKMYKENMPSVFDTSDSFYPSSQFDYHSKKADYECRIMLQNKEKAISSLLQQQPIKKEQLEELIGYIQKETDSMISELLSEATHLRQKLRTQKDCYQTTIRELKSRLRSLSEENMEIVSQLQLKERVHKEEVQQLSKNKKATILQKSNLGKQIEGMQRLLNQYQIELEKKQGQILLLKKQMQEKTAFCQTAKSQILNQSTVIQELKQRVYLLQRQYKTQQIINSTQKGNQINLLMKKDFVFHTQINDREYLIRSLDEEALKKEKQIQSLVETVKKLNQLLQMEKSKQKIEKNSEKDSILKLQTATQTAITLIRQKHNDKLQKIAELMKKQLKKLKKQIQAFKVSTIKQIQLCQKQTKGVLISQLKTLYLK